MAANDPSLAAAPLDRAHPALARAAVTLRGATPAKGWARALRQALGMTTRALGQRTGLAQQSIVELEKSEARGSITVASLRRLAASLDAEFVYALVPKEPPSRRRHLRARELARQRLRAELQAGALEARTLTDDEIRQQIDVLTHELERRPRELWP